MDFLLQIWDGLMALIVCVVVLRVAFIAVCALWDLLERTRQPLPNAPQGAQNTWPGVTIIVPMYNEAMVIRETLVALLEGQYPNREILVIDDGSTDGGAAIVQELAKAHPEIQLLVQRPNQGKSAA